MQVFGNFSSRQCVTYINCVNNNKLYDSIYILFNNYTRKLQSSNNYNIDLQTGLFRSRVVSFFHLKSASICYCWEAGKSYLDVICHQSRTPRLSDFLLVSNPGGDYQCTKIILGVISLQIVIAFFGGKYSFRAYLFILRRHLL